MVVAAYTLSSRIKNTHDIITQSMLNKAMALVDPFEFYNQPKSSVAPKISLMNLLLVF